VYRLVFFFLFCIFLIIPFVTFASTFNDAMHAMKNENYEEAVKIFRIAAEKGDKYSQHCLGVMLYKGQGVKKDYKESFKWLNLAAKQGLSQAKFDLGILIYYKKGIPENYKE
jgi:TPR repeat protein